MTNSGSTAANDRELKPIFKIDARRCRRCGGLLTSRQAIRAGCGPTCLRKERAELLAMAQEARDQISLFDTTEGDDHGTNDSEAVPPEPAGED